ncbi:unnamed protein product [Lymnaea stagnalis]|uniref:Elongator complex protein 2 n=1 Tax=Lymnaea stagnalis TaxID=6523 RepID=A0AAV2GXL5_LYMST
MAPLSICYTSAGCNRCPFSADWGRNGLICFAYSNAIAIYQPEGFSNTGGIIRTYTGHTDRVNCVTWIKNGTEGESELVSGSTDSTINIWSYDSEAKLNQPVCTLKGHEGSVTCVSALYIPQDGGPSSTAGETLIVSASTDSTVRIWSRYNSDAKEEQVLKFGTGFALSLSTFIIPGTNVPILVCGCDDHNIYLYMRGLDRQFMKVTVLSGHEDWVRDLHLTSDDKGDILLASCAQDHLIRIWKFVRKNNLSDVNNVKPISELQTTETITVKETIFSFSGSDQELYFALTLESVLSGHENWVYSVKWQPSVIQGNGSLHQPMKLLSASMDKTMILWSFDKDSQMWLEQVRVGDVGGNTLGFFGGLFSPCGGSILAHGYQGAFNQWYLNEETKIWEPQVTGGGHFGSVVDIAWSGGGSDFLLSASVDQTTRLHAPWIRDKLKPTWYEIARPQVHGYDLQCLAMLGKYSFASGADEKLVRIFKAPRNFISNFCHICGHDLSEELRREECLSLPEGANVPALGLSNKAVYIDGDKESQTEEEQTTKQGQYPENYFNAIDLKSPPSEDLLLQNTLWPEEAKLYGHGYEIFTLAASPDGQILASACKAAKAENANILVWDMTSKKSLASLSGCTLTVTQMAFSNKGDQLLAVSRDRTWALYSKSGKTGLYFISVVSHVDKKASHTRIIWSCSWSRDDKFFFTGSRDKKVLVWSSEAINSNTSSPVPVSSLTLPDSVTAIAAAPCFVQNRYLIAIGLDNGQIFIYTWLPPSALNGDGSNEWTEVSTLMNNEAHHLTVNRLTFRSHLGRLGYSDESSNWLQLASCGGDSAVRVYDLDLSKL